MEQKIKQLTWAKLYVRLRAADGRPIPHTNNGAQWWTLDSTKESHPGYSSGDMHTNYGFREHPVTACHIVMDPILQDPVVHLHFKYERERTAWRPLETSKPDVPYGPEIVSPIIHLDVTNDRLT